jgi:hypothetical protein
LKIALELDGEVIGDTLPRSSQPGDPEPLLLVSRHTAGRSLFFRHDVPDAVRSQLQSASDAELDDPNAICALLSSVGPVDRVIPLVWYTVGRTPDRTEFPDVTMRDGRFVVLVDGNVAAQAWADRSNALAEEVSVATVPAYRGRGFARQVVSAWMHGVRTAGKIGFYSHNAANTASRALARSAGVVWLADEVEFIQDE